MVNKMKDELLSFMAKHNFERISDFKGHSLQYFTTHADLVKRQAEAKAAAKAKVGVVAKDGEWQGDQFVKQTDALARG
jgi:dihydropyrimidine dehydrogenase (NADP+)/dihydropyrimidine dehydrogenase (NAD+) subunit PreA